MTDTHELADAVRGVMGRGGRTIISTDFLPTLPSPIHERRPAISQTARERDILMLLVEGQSKKAIARHLDLREGTVRIYVSGSAPSSA